MIQEWLMSVICTAAIGLAPVAESAAPQPTPANPVPCPMVQAAKAVKTPANTLPGPPARPPGHSPVGGPELGTPGLAVPAGSPNLPGNLGARAWLVADMDSGAVLGACGPHERYAPASVQKLLLVATFIDKLDPNRVIEVTPGDLDFEAGSSAVGLINGGKYSIETLWLGLLLVSGNDAANVLARVGGGDGGLAGGLKAMNDFAHRLGARDTHAVTPSGLDGAGQFSSPYDLALIAKAAFSSERFRRYTLTQSAQIPAQPPKDTRGFQIQNDNRLIYDYRGALGGKTGFTDVARHSFVGAAERDGRRLIVTVMGAEIVPVRTWQQGASLLDWGFGLPRTASVGNLVKPGEIEAAASASAAASARPTSSGTAGQVQDGMPALVIWSVSILAVTILAVGLPTIALTRRSRSSVLDEEYDEDVSFFSPSSHSSYPSGSRSRSPRRSDAGSRGGGGRERPPGVARGPQGGGARRTPYGDRDTYGGRSPKDESWGDWNSGWDRSASDQWSQDDSPGWGTPGRTRPSVPRSSARPRR